MKNRKKIITASALVLALAGLSTADYLTSGDEYASWVGDDINDRQQSSQAEEDGGVPKNAGPDVDTTIDEAGFEAGESDDLTLLGQVATEGVRTVVVLDNGDRAGSVTWVQTPEVKQIFNALKESLITAFSPQMTGLRDVTLQDEGKPVRNVLTFTDPAISEEEIVFVRVRERLFEFHVAEGSEEAMSKLIEAITGN